jgi:hypothetical protein
LNDFKFGNDLADKNEFNTSLSIETNCFVGKCKLGFFTYNTDNCTKACFNEVKDCYYNGQKCDENICTKYSWKTGQSICQEFNRIKKWRDTEMFEYSEEYKIIPYSQIKPKNGNCDSGYKKCGKINKDGDFLCLEEELECPINDIIVKSTNSPPSGAEYSKYQIGDQFIFYTNQKTDNFMIKYFYINFDTDTNNDDSLIKIDKDSVSNLSKYNYIYFDEYRTKPKTAYLNYVQYFSNFTYEEMLKFQDIYVKKNEIYSKELIDEMNSNVKSHKYLLMAFGIVFLGYIVCICVFFFPIYGAACNCGKACAECCGLCQNITPIKRVSHFYFAFLPCFILMLVSFFITISKKKLIINIYLWNLLMIIKIINMIHMMKMI